MSGRKSNAEILRELDACENAVTRGVLKDTIVNRFREMQPRPIEGAPVDGTEIVAIEISEKYAPVFNVCFYSHQGRWMVNAPGDQEMRPTHFVPKPEMPEAP